MSLVPPVCEAGAPSAEVLQETAQDRHDIEALLATYTRAVSTKDQAMFETLLLNKDIPFAYVDGSSAKVAKQPISDYEGFRKGVFLGSPFTQSFKNVSIEQDGNLASVKLVFVNTTAQSSSWGWKTMLLLKVNGTWKIASEFFTGHAS